MRVGQGRATGWIPVDVVNIQHMEPAIPTLRWPLRTLPEVIVAGRFPLADRDFTVSYGPSAVVSLHLYDYEGAIRFGDGPAIPLHPGDVTLSPAGGVTRYHLPRPGQHWCIHFRPVPVTHAAAEIPLHLSLGPHRPRVAETMARIASHFAAAIGEGERSAVAASAALQELLLVLAGLARRAPGPTDATLDRAAVLLGASLDQPLAVPELACAVGLTQNYLARRFRTRFGVTMQRYRLGLRIDHARMLLAHTELAIGQIAGRCGFPDVQSFNKQFRRIAGESPTAWRRRRIGRDAYSRVVQLGRRRTPPSSPP
jgi:AraC-like DNA-binding protein